MKCFKIITTVQCALLLLHKEMYSGDWSTLSTFTLLFVPLLNEVRDIGTENDLSWIDTEYDLSWFFSTERIMYCLGDHRCPGLCLVVCIQQHIAEVPVRRTRYY